MRTVGKQNYLDSPWTILYVLGICLICWIVGYLTSLGYPIYEEKGDTPLWDLLCRLLPNKLFTYIIGFVLMVGGAFLLHRANYALVLIREKTFLPFLLYILFLSTNPNFFPLKSTSIGVFCLILAIYQLFTFYHNPEATGKAFKSTFIIGLGSLLWVHIVWFVPLFWLGMYRFRSLTYKTFAASLLGVLTVYWFVLGWSVWKEDFTLFTAAASSLSALSLLRFEITEWVEWISVICMTILALVASFNIITHEHEDNLRTRQFLSFLIIFALWAFVLFFLNEYSSEEFLHVTCIPASIIIAHFFSARRNKYTFWLFIFTIVLFPILLFIQLGWNFL